MKSIGLRHSFAAFIVFGFLAGCSSISPFSQKAYEQATTLKVEALATMDKATNEYSSQKQAIDNLNMNVEKAYEYAKGRPNNEISTHQWEDMKDPSRNLLGGFLKRWESSKSLSVEFIEGAKVNVSDGFDQIIGLESGKEKPTSGQKQ